MLRKNKMEESNVRVNKLKGQRKPKAVKKEEEEDVETVDIPAIEEEKKEEPEPEKKPEPKKVTKKKPVVEQEDYDVEQQLPDLVIHKRHKGAKPRKIIVVTADSDVDSSDEELPYRKKTPVQVKKRQAKPEPEPEPEPKPEPKPKTQRKQNVGYVGKSNDIVDAGKGMPEVYARAAAEKPAKNYVVDPFIDGLLGL